MNDREMDDVVNPKIAEYRKIDEVVNAKIDKITAKGRGFVLSMIPDVHSDIEQLFRRLSTIQHLVHESDKPNSDKIEDKIVEIVYGLGLVSAKCSSATIEVRESLPPVDEHIPLSRKRKHNIGDTDSFIRYALKYGDADKSLVMYNDDAVYLVIDESIERGDREIVKMDLDPSSEWRAWSKMIGSPLKHSEFHKFLTKWSISLMDPQILNSTRTVRANVQVKHDSDLQEDNNTIGMLVTSKAGEEIKKFPKKISIKLPVLDQDVEYLENWVSLQLSLDIQLPDSPTGQVLFTLECNDTHVPFRNRVRQECKKISDALIGWTVVRGDHKTFNGSKGVHAKSDSPF